MRQSLAAILFIAAPAHAEEAFITAQNADAVTVIDPDVGRIVAEIRVAGAPAGVAMAPGRQAYITCPDGKALAILDAATRSVVGRVALDGGPLGVAVGPDGRAVYVAD